MARYSTQFVKLNVGSVLLRSSRAGLPKKRVWLAKGYGSFQSAWRTLPGSETMHMIRKG
jgi:hypothetical protein